MKRATLTADVLVGAISTVRCAVTEESLRQTLAGAALNIITWADGFLPIKEWPPRLGRLVLCIAKQN